MYLIALATDYDGTLAHHGRVDAQSVAALERLKASGRKLLMVTVDGRQQAVSVGVSLTEMAHIMAQLGSVEAMNLDGGSSTQMVVAGRLVNSPSVALGARVSNCLIVRTARDYITSQAGGAAAEEPGAF